MKESLESPVRTLLVDDNHDFIVSLTHWLVLQPSIQIVGYAESGAIALEQIDKLKPDLVLMDSIMPGMNGFETTRLLKSRAAAPRVIILTLHDEDVYRVAAQSVGADGVIDKAEITARLLSVVHAPSE